MGDDDGDDDDDDGDDDDDDDGDDDDGDDDDDDGDDELPLRDNWQIVPKIGMMTEEMRNLNLPPS